MSDDDRERGLYAKYQVTRLDDPEGKHADCRYFVLDPEHDPLARRPLRMYQTSARARGYTLLANDLREWLTDIYRRHLRD